MRAQALAPDKRLQRTGHQPMWRIAASLVLVAAIGCTDPKPTTFEASMNFDSENVEPFLNQLNERLALDLPVAKLLELTLSTRVDDERSTTIDVLFDGSRTRLEYRVFMDDVDAPDLSFFTPSSALAKAIDSQLREFADARGM